MTRAKLKTRSLLPFPAKIRYRAGSSKPLLSLDFDRSIPLLLFFFFPSSIDRTKLLFADNIRNCIRTIRRGIKGVYIPGMYIYADGCYFEWMRINNKRNERTEARKGRRIFSLFLFFLLFLSTSNNRYCLHIREKFTRDAGVT